MIGVFLFLAGHSMRNRFARRLRRLREPRYFLATAVGVLWLGFWVLRPLLAGRGPARFSSIAVLGPWHEAIVLAGSVLLFLYVASIWILPSERASLRFSEAEIHFLFTAPIERRQLVHYKLLRAQFGILFGAVISSFVLGGRIFHPDAWGRIAGFWLLYAVLNLHSLGAAFVRTDLLDHGVSGLRRRVLPLFVVLAVAVLAVVGVRQAVEAVAARGPALLDPRGEVLSRAAAIAGAIVDVAHRGILGAVLWPFQVLPRLILTDPTKDFAHGFLPWLGLAPVVLGLHYLWVVRSEASFEEASVEAAQRASARRLTRGGGRRGRISIPLKARAFPWQPRSAGRPAVGIVWKNLVSLTRIVPVRSLIVLAALGLGFSSWGVALARAHTHVGLILALLFAELAGFLSFFGAFFLRCDLRQDLLHLDQIKTFPVSGRELVTAEVLAPVWVLVAGQWLALAGATISFSVSGVARLWRLDAGWWLAIGAACLFLLPAVSLAAVTLQNAIVLLFPAWVDLSGGRARGFEASGQRILTLLGTLVTLAVAFVPAAFLGGVVSLILSGVLGPMSLVLGAMLAAGVVAFEAWLALGFLGRAFDRLDSSTAGIDRQEA